VSKHHKTTAKYTFTIHTKRKIVILY